MIFPVQLTTSRIGSITRLIHTLLYVMTIHTYIHTHIRYIHNVFQTETSLYEVVKLDCKGENISDEWWEGGQLRGFFSWCVKPNTYELSS